MNFVMYPHGTSPWTANHAAKGIPELNIIDQMPNKAVEPTAAAPSVLFVVGVIKFFGFGERQSPAAVAHLFRWTSEPTRSVGSAS